MAVADRPLTPNEFAVELLGIADRIAGHDYSPLLKDLRRPLFAGFSGNFTAAAAADGSPWPPRKNPKAKGRSGYAGHPLLIDKGDLYLSVTSSQGPGHIENISNDELILGTNLPYAGIHQDGGGRMPQREFLAVDDDKLDEIEPLIVDYVDAEVIGF